MDPDTQTRIEHIDGLMVQLRTQIAQKQVELVALEAGFEALDKERYMLTSKQPALTSIPSADKE